MIVKSYKLADINNLKCNFFLFYGENEGQKDEAITKIFKNFKGEIVKYEENQIIENKNNFDTCYNESLFGNSKVIIYKSYIKNYMKSLKN